MPLTYATTEDLQAWLPGEDLPAPDNADRVWQALVEFGADITARDGEDCGILAYDVGREIGAFLRERGATE